MRLLSGPLGALAEVERLLTPAEKSRLASMGDRRHAAARAHAYVLIRELLDLDAGEATVEYHGSGRPFVRGWDGDVSIAHSGDRVLVGVVGSPGRIGVDVVSLDVAFDPAAFLRHALVPAEQSEVERLTARSSLRTALAVLWSAKEAAAKCLGSEFVPRKLVVRSGEEGTLQVESPTGRVRCEIRVHQNRVEAVAVS